MALEALLAKLDEDAREEREALLADARKRAANFREESEAELSRVRTRALDAIRAREAGAARSATSKARAEARRIVFQARTELLDRVRSAVGERIAEASEDTRYRRALPAELDSALARMPAGRVELRAREELEGPLRQVLDDLESGRDQVVMIRDPAVAPGFLLVSDDGAVIVDATLAVRLERAWRGESVRLLQEVRP